MKLQSKVVFKVDGPHKAAARRGTRSNRTDSLSLPQQEISLGFGRRIDGNTTNPVARSLI